MPKFALPLKTPKPVTVNRKQVFYLCQFRLPEDCKEHVPYSDTRHLEVDQLMGFYSQPSVGDLVEYFNIDWVISAVIHRPSKRYSRDEKFITRLLIIPL